jgi:signal transduction histidine kinase
VTDEVARLARRWTIAARLADDLAHEVRNPLNAVVINLELLRTRARLGDVEAALERADIVEAEMRRAHALIESLVRLLRSDTDGTHADLAAVLDDIVPLIEAAARRRRQTLRVAGTTPALPLACPPADARFALLAAARAVIDAVSTGADIAIEALAGLEDTEVRVAGGPPAGPPPHAAATAATTTADAIARACGGSARLEADTTQDVACIVRLPCRPSA